MLLFPSQLEQGEMRFVVCTAITGGAALRGVGAGLETEGERPDWTGRGQTGVGGENRKG